ncbi:hypothetical protein ACLQ25_09500 [Micromonospora sp. DT44]|uniref:hypothetical protein n=1 Tax=Micromonospora sp. DT44 TaxID=3393439 RepID=UPI003CF8E941
MARLLVELHVEMEDGTMYGVVADQRDIAKWEVQDFGCPFTEVEDRTPMLAMRWLAWSALSRRGEVTLAWPEFDAACLEADSTQGDDEDEGADGPAVAADGLDPGLTDPPASTSSSSPGGPDSL